jgi:hypothetical protein
MAANLNQRFIRSRGGKRWRVSRRFRFFVFISVFSVCSVLTAVCSAKKAGCSALTAVSSAKTAGCSALTAVSSAKTAGCSALTPVSSAKAVFLSA